MREHTHRNTNTAALNGIVKYTERRNYAAAEGRESNTNSYATTSILTYCKSHSFHEYSISIYQMVYSNG